MKNEDGFNEEGTEEFGYLFDDILINDLIKIVKPYLKLMKLI